MSCAESTEGTVSLFGGRTSKIPSVTLTKGTDGIDGLMQAIASAAGDPVLRSLRVYEVVRPSSAVGVGRKTRGNGRMTNARAVRPRALAEGVGCRRGGKRAACEMSTA